MLTRRQRRCSGPPLLLCTVALIALSTPAAGQRPETLSEQVHGFVSVDSETVALIHVRVVDGRGGPPLDDQTVVLSGNRIAALGPSGEVQIPDGAEILELEGHTVIPGIVGLHDHTH